MNQVENQLANQPNEWIWMLCFQTTFHKSTMLCSLITETNGNLLRSLILIKRPMILLRQMTKPTIYGKSHHQSISILMNCIDQLQWWISAQQHTFTWQAHKISHLPAFPSLLSVLIWVQDCHVGFTLASSTLTVSCHATALLAFKPVTLTNQNHFFNDSIESHSWDASFSWLKQDMQCLQNVGPWASMS